VVLPTAKARRAGLDAAQENMARLRDRWHGRPWSSARQTRPAGDSADGWALAELAAKIRAQEAAKACGADGIHV
jgi:hypothetical protein